MFDAIVGHDIGTLNSTHAYLLTFDEESWTRILPDKLQRFSGIVYHLSHYVRFLWHVIQVPVMHQFHAHNFLQQLFIHEIRQLTKEMKNGIQLELKPLPVQSQLSSVESRKGK